MYARGPEIHAEISLLMEKLAAPPTPPMPKAREWKGPSSCNTMISRVPLESPFFQGRMATHKDCLADRLEDSTWSYARSSWPASPKA